MSKINMQTVGLKEEDILLAIDAVDQEVLNEIFPIDRESVKYTLIYNNKTYPPMYIVELAYNLKFPNKKIGPRDHTPKNDIKLLKSLGFEVTLKVLSEEELEEKITNFIQQARTTDQSRKDYLYYNYNGLTTNASFGRGEKAAIPWVAFLASKQTVSHGIYPVILLNTISDELVVAYGVSETKKSTFNWPDEVYNNKSIDSLNWPKYKESLIYAYYSDVTSFDTNELSKKIVLDINKLTTYYLNYMKKQNQHQMETTFIDKPKNNKQYFWLNANSKNWSFPEYSIGDEQAYSAYNENGNKRRIFENFEKAQPGDIIVGYEASPTKKVVALCEITESLKDDEDGNKILPFIIKEFFKYQPSWDELKEDKRLQNSSIINNRQGSLFELTEEEFNTIIEYTKSKQYEPYKIEDALKEIFIEKSELERIGTLLKHKKNIILQGPPGVGKTFVAKRLAHLQMGKKDDNRVQMIQFHQSYAYEDFIQGYRPNEEGKFELINGVFYRFCQKARNNPEQAYFFIIDEINRGNLSKIFGELMMLIEHDKRGEDFAMPLTYSPSDTNLFYIPRNVYIIGTMNTADRSLAIVDYALRRRFAFIDIKPNFDQAFNNFLFNSGIPPKIITKISTRINALNKRIENDKNLGKGFLIGHSYFCNFNGSNDRELWYQQIIENEVGPMLHEYWFDDQDKAQQNTDLLLET